MSDTVESFDLNDNGVLDLDIYFDFQCAYSYQAMLWIRQISELMGTDVIAVRWKFFSNEGNIWEKPGEAKGSLAFAAGGAAHAIGGEAGLGLFYAELGKQLHEENKALDKATIEAAWKAVGMNEADLSKVLDSSNQHSYQKLSQDHNEGVERFNIHATPTLVFEEHRSILFKVMPAPVEDISDALELFQHVQRLAMGFRGAVQEIRRTNS